MDWKDILKKVAPTVATALGGPAAGMAVTAIGSLFGMTDASEDKIKDFLESGQLTPEHIFELKKLELQFKNDEKERGFKYADLEVKDRASARNMMVTSGAKTPAILTWIIVVIVLGLEGAMLFGAKPEGVSEIILGRILGTLDAALLAVMNFWFGTTYGSSRKTDLLAGGAK